MIWRRTGESVFLWRCLSDRPPVRVPLLFDMEESQAAHLRACSGSSVTTALWLLSAFLCCVSVLKVVFLICSTSASADGLIISAFLTFHPGLFAVVWEWHLARMRSPPVWHRPCQQKAWDLQWQRQPHRAFVKKLKPSLCYFSLSSCVYFYKLHRLKIVTLSSESGGVPWMGFSVTTKDLEKIF